MMMHEKSQILVSVLIVNYESLTELRKSLYDLNEMIPMGTVEILIANNDRRKIPKGIEKIATNALSTQVFHRGSNKGFGGANNYIAAQAGGTYLLFLNPDTYDFSCSIQVLIDLIEREGCDIVAPTITNPDGTLQNFSYGTMVTPWSIIWDNLAKVAMSNKEVVRDEQFLDQTDVDWVTGAAFMLKSADFHEVGGFDENFFLYFEDIDLCRRLKHGGKNIHVTKEMTIKHDSGASAKSHKSQKRHYYKAQDYYFKKHYGPGVAKVISILRNVTHPL